MVLDVARVNRNSCTNGRDHDEACPGVICFWTLISNSLTLFCKEIMSSSR